jgi:hypothetical protein
MPAVQRRTKLILLGVLALALALLGLGQLLLPPIAADRIESRLRRYGRVESVSVSAWPALKLLWGDADAVKVRASRLALTPAQTASLLWEARGASRLDMTASSVREGSLALSGVSLRKRGRQLSGTAATSEADVAAALPPGLSLTLVGSEAGTVRVRASGGLFGLGATVEAVAAARDGRLVAHPLGPLLEQLELTLFADPHVHIEGVGASAQQVAGAPGYRLDLAARLG